MEGEWHMSYISKKKERQATGRAGSEWAGGGVEKHRAKRTSLTKGTRGLHIMRWEAECHANHAQIIYHTNE